MYCERMWSVVSLCLWKVLISLNFRQIKMSRYYFKQLLKIYSSIFNIRAASRSKDHARLFSSDISRSRLKFDGVIDRTSIYQLDTLSSKVFYTFYILWIPRFPKWYFYVKLMFKTYCIFPLLISNIQSFYNKMNICI